MDTLQIIALAALMHAGTWQSSHRPEIKPAPEAARIATAAPQIPAKPRRTDWTDMIESEN